MWRCKGKTESDVHLYNYEINPFTGKGVILHHARID